MRALRLLALIPFLCVNVLAAKLPAQFLSGKTFTEVLRAPLVTKLAQMDQNFIKGADANQVFFYSAQEVVCQDGSKVSPGMRLLRLAYSKELLGKVYTEKRLYYGCSGNLGFVETIRVDGATTHLHTDKEIISGQLKLGMVDSAAMVSYRMEDGEGNGVYEFNSSENTVQGYAEFKVDDQKIFTRQIKVSGKKKFIGYAAHPFTLESERNGYHFHFKSNGFFQGKVFATIEDGNISYFGTGRERVSQAAFQDLFQVSNFGAITESLLAYLPKTKFVSSGLQSAKMLEELRNAQTFLISGTQLNLVRNLIEEYIKAVQEGSIVDRRK